MVVNWGRNPADLMLHDLKEKYEAQAPSPAFSRLYTDDQELGHMFAVLHKKLNAHFEAINGRAKTTRHYWADNSRDLIALIDELNEDRHSLKRAGIDVALDERYQEAIERCEPWLSQSGGSTIPYDFEQIEIVKYEPIFNRAADTIKLKKQDSAVKLKTIGEGSYAIVFSYVDPDYGKKFAVKRAKRGIGERDLARFKQEFDVMKRLSFPYIVEVYKYDEGRNEYRMEFCDETLRTYIATRNNRLSFSSRKRIALQFLYGINYIHQEGLLHRDISLQNVLVKVFGMGAVLVKLSDFGLVKEKSSDFTRTHTEMRGTIRDPLLHDFKTYSAVNEMYSIGSVLSYIFTGRESLKADGDEMSRIVQKCADLNTANRYQSVLELVADVERLEATQPTDAPA
ncbi:protein kinase family protein [Sinomonas mesophila]|uniref:protein kinase family protein n=1 Tax=Sinomonas mesophila TaxID=1531955 RepID=UPI000984D9CF|nr:protein kinase family protein [Sinomonas mesophila]